MEWQAGALRDAQDYDSDNCYEFPHFYNDGQHTSPEHENEFSWVLLADHYSPDLISFTLHIFSVQSLEISLILQEKLA